jgi:peptide/nickel transport system ATP-binding protein
MHSPLLDVEDLSVRFDASTGPVEAVRGISFTLDRERLAIVGESGSGKSVAAKSLLGLAGRKARVTAKRARFDGIDLLAQTERQRRTIRGRRIAMIVQDAKHGLNPIRTVGQQLGEMLLLHRKQPLKSLAHAVETLLEEVHIREPRRVAALYPSQLSGGMAQRVMIAMMLAGDPDILIADEATSALDALVQRRILELIDERVRQRGMGLILISHDLDLVADFADRILVMYRGRVMETLRGGSDYADARHPYTRGLAACVPTFRDAGQILPVLERDPEWSR